MARLAQMETQIGREMLIEVYKARSAATFYDITTRGEERDFAKEMVREEVYRRMGRMTELACRQGLDISRDYAVCYDYLNQHNLG